MIRQCIQILLRNKQKNFLLLIQFIFSLLALYMLNSSAIQLIEDRNRKIGYEAENLIGGTISDLRKVDSVTFPFVYQEMNDAIEEIRKLDYVEHASYTWSMPYGFFVSISNIYVKAVMDPEMLKSLGIKVIEGEGFTKELELDETQYILLNKAAADYLKQNGFAKVIGLDFIRDIQQDSSYSGLPWTVIGVVDEYLPLGRYQSENPYTAIQLSKFENRDFMLAKRNFNNYQNLVVICKSNSNHSKALFEINGILKQYLGHRVFSLYSIEQLESQAGKESFFMFCILMTISVLLFLNISIGIVALVKENLVKRRKEIGIRMALGSTETQVFMQFAGEMLLLGCFAFFISMTIIISLDMSSMLEFKLRFLEIISTFFVLLLIIFISIYKPVKKACTIKPNIALHYD